jgi:phasin protein
MAQSKQEPMLISNSASAWTMAPAFANPILMMLADMNGMYMEGLATAQREWAEFLQRRIREDMAVTRHLLNCHSLADMHQVYAQYLQTAFQQYREQSEKVTQRGESIAQHLADTTAAKAKDVDRAHH